MTINIKFAPVLGLLNSMTLIVSSQAEFTSFQFPTPTPASKAAPKAAPSDVLTVTSSVSNTFASI